MHRLCLIICDFAVTPKVCPGVRQASTWVTELFHNGRTGEERSRTWQNAFEAHYGAWEIGSKLQTGGFVVLEDDALLHPARQFTRDASAYPSDGVTLLGGSIRSALHLDHAMDCETHGIIVDLLTNFSDGVHPIQRFCNARGVGQASLARTSSSSRTNQELREAVDPDSDRALVLKWSCCQAYYLSTAVVQDTVLAVGFGAAGRLPAAALSPSTISSTLDTSCCSA